MESDMARQFIMAAAIYIVGGIALAIWSLSAFAGGAPREDWALMIVLPLAWTFSFWPAYGSLTMLYRARAAEGTLRRVVEQLRSSTTPDSADVAELEDYATQLIARENRLPAFIVRPLVRKGLARAIARGMARSGQDQADSAR